MKRLIILSGLIIFSLSSICAANSVWVEAWQGGTAKDTLQAGLSAQLRLYSENTQDLGGLSLGLEISGELGLQWTWNSQKYDTSSWANQFSLTGNLITEYDVDGNLPEVILFGGATIVSIPPAIRYLGLNGETNTDAVGLLRNLCLDTIFVPPAGNFVFVDEFGTAFAPNWLPGDQPVCIPVLDYGNDCPEFTTAGGSVDIGRCGIEGHFDFAATDFEGDDITFSIYSNNGNGTWILSNHGDGTGEISYVSSPDDPDTVTIEVAATDPFHSTEGCTASLFSAKFNVVLNFPPQIYCGLPVNKAQAGQLFTKKDIAAIDPDDCDDFEYFIFSLDNSGRVPINLPTIDQYGVFSWTPELSEVGVWECTVGVTDGVDTSLCTFLIEVLRIEPYFLQIACIENVILGHFVTVPIYSLGGSEAMGGFDLLIAYDASVLNFIEVSLGDDFASCGWEYFTYRFGWHGNCGNGCPSGEIRVVGMAETNNGPYHPSYDCIAATQNGATLVNLEFYIDDNFLYGGQCMPINFVWFDCGDNAISVASGDTLALAEHVFPAGVDVHDWDNAFPIPDEFPTMYGAPESCFGGDKLRPHRLAIFQNGCICGIPNNEIDDRGDINTNGVSNEIADAVMFANFFISGPSAFGSHIDASIAASDVNADGTALSVADLVYLVRIIIGDALPYPKPAPGTSAHIELDGETVRYDVNGNMGAILLAFDINEPVVPELSIPGIDIKYGQVGDEFHVLIYSLEGRSIPAGNGSLMRLPGGGQLLSCEAATAEGAVLDVDFAGGNNSFGMDIEQNYPNPVYDKTSIYLNMTQPSDWTLSIYNVTGQLVRQFNGSSEAGRTSITWDGTDQNGRRVASGIYFYKADVGDISKTKKMILMK